MANSSLFNDDKNKKTEFMIVGGNATSLNKTKVQYLRAVISKKKVDVFCFSEVRAASGKLYIPYRETSITSLNKDNRGGTRSFKWNHHQFFKQFFVLK